MTLQQNKKGEEEFTKGQAERYQCGGEQQFGAYVNIDVDNPLGHSGEQTIPNSFCPYLQVPTRTKPVYQPFSMPFIDQSTKVKG